MLNPQGYNAHARKRERGRFCVPPEGALVRLRLVLDRVTLFDLTLLEPVEDDDATEVHELLSESFPFGFAAPPDDTFEDEPEGVA